MDPKVRRYLNSDNFRRALDVREQPRVFIDLVARSLGPKGQRLRKWSSTIEDAELKQKIDVILNQDGGCYDEWAFLFTACGSAENPEGHLGSNTGSWKNTGNVSDIRGNIGYEKIPQQDTIQLVGERVNELYENILKLVSSTALSGGRKFIVLQGEGMTGKTTLFLKLREALDISGVSVSEYKQLSTTGQLGSLTSPGLIYMDDADLENSNAAAEMELVKYFRGRRHTMLFICRNTSKLQSIMSACDAKVFKMPDYTDDDTIKILSGTVIRGYTVSEKTCKQMVSLMTAFGIDSKLSVGMDVIRMLLFPRIQKDCTLGVEQSVIQDISFTISEIEESLRDVTGIKVAVRSSLASRTHAVRTKIESRIIGQEKVLDALMPTLTSIAAGLTDPGRPAGVLMFYGPSGVGKTELGRVIADVLFEGVFFKEDMNTYSEKHSVSRFSGAPPGYIGYGEVPKVMEFLDSNTRGVLLLDEIEKAHETVMEHIMELLDTGMLADTRGKRHDARGFLIISTSNITWGQKDSVVGFTQGKQKTKCFDPRVEVRNTKIFKEEILNRFQTIVKFESLDGKDLNKIAALILDDLELRLESVGISRKKDVRDEYLNLIVKSYKSEVGARGMKNYTETEIKNRIVSSYLETETNNKIKEGGGS